MKAKPKTVWVVFKDENTPMGAETVNPGKDWYPGCEHVRYHLHPGNEVKLKRENAAMRKWIIRENGGKRSVKQCPCLRCKKLREVVADW